MPYPDACRPTVPTCPPPRPRPTSSGSSGCTTPDGSLRGELTYWVGARLGRAHCSLCDITHGLVHEQSEWRTYHDGLPVPFGTRTARDDQPAEVRATTGDVAPVVVAETTAGIVNLLAPADLDACEGSADRLVEALDHAIRQQALLSPSR